MSTDNVPNTTVTTISNQEVDFHMVNTEERSDIHSETSQCGYIKYKHTWKAA